MADNRDRGRPSCKEKKQMPTPKKSSCQNCMPEGRTKCPFPAERVWKVSASWGRCHSRELKGMKEEKKGDIRMVGVRGKVILYLNFVPHPLATAWRGVGAPGFGCQASGHPSLGRHEAPHVAYCLVCHTSDSKCWKYLQVRQSFGTADTDSESARREF